MQVNYILWVFSNTHPAPSREGEYTYQNKFSFIWLHSCNFALKELVFKGFHLQEGSFSCHSLQDNAVGAGFARPKHT